MINTLDRTSSNELSTLDRDTAPEASAESDAYAPSSLSASKVQSLVAALVLIIVVTACLYVFTQLLPITVAHGDIHDAQNNGASAH